MKLTRLLSIVVSLVLVVSALSIWFKSSVQNYMEGNTTWNGMKDFSSSSGAVTIGSLGPLASAPVGSILLAIPDLSYSNEDLGRIAQFVNSGGTLLLMDDAGYGNNILEYLNMGVRFAGGELLDPLFCYKNPEFPRILSFAPDFSADAITAVTLDHGTSLINVGDGEVLASSSDMSFMDVNGNGSWDANEARGPLVVAARYQINAGYVELVSDPSIIANSMLNVGDNAAFLKYLTSDTAEGSELFIDRSHLIETPLDIAKLFLVSTRKTLSDAYAVIGVLAVLFIIVSLNMAGKGENSD